MTKLAVDGGTPVRASLLPYGRHLIDDVDIQAVVEALRSDWLTTGPRVEQFERAVAEFVGARFAVAVSSGTAALHAAVAAAGIGAGDEVITTPLTFVASANCALYVGARPVFADVLEDSLTIDPRAVADRVSSRTKAIIPVDLCGQPADLDEIRSIAARHGLRVIADAAHSLGATYRGRRVGALADMTVFSTHPVKHITTGEGGLVTTDDERLADRLRRFRNHGITSDARARQAAGEWAYEVVELGYNYRLTDVQSALGLSQLGKLEPWLSRRSEIAARYTRALGGSPALRTPTVRDDRVSAWHLYAIRVRPGALSDGLGRNAVFKALRAENIGVNVHYIPIPLHPFYRAQGYTLDDCPVARAAYEELITLPIFPAMTDADADDVITAVHKVLAAYTDKAVMVPAS